MKAALDRARKLFHGGALALAVVESNGVRVDRAYLKKAVADTEALIADKEKALKADKVWRLWRKEFDKPVLGNADQLGRLFFGVMGHKAPGLTAKGRLKADEKSFAAVDHPFPKEYFAWKHLIKVRSTYLLGVLNEQQDGVLHPFFNLDTVRTYRGSSSLPNFQNFPIRNPEMARLIRTAFIPRKGRLLVEFDFSGAEVRSAACYNKDPELIRYIQDPRSDMHRDQAVELFMLPPDLVDKKTTRDVSKNSFVFAEFYGSYYVDCARNIWEVMVSRGFKLPDGTSVKDHLAKKGIKKLGACDPSRKPVPGTFEHHVKGVEDRLWNQRFPAYRDWKKRWYSAYLKKGHFDSLTGFRMRGIFSRNDCINYPVQGTAFHWLLWTLVRLQRWLEKHNFRCKIVGQIHDSIILDCPPEELQAVLEEAHRLVTVGLGKYWDWICVPLDVEADVSDTNWHEKKQWVRGGSGVWGIGK